MKPIISQEIFDQAHAVMDERTQKAKDGRKKHEHVINPDEIGINIFIMCMCAEQMKNYILAHENLLRKPI
jgi:hypothetical protein